MDVLDWELRPFDADCLSDLFGVLDLLSGLSGLSALVPLPDLLLGLDLPCCGCERILSGAASEDWEDLGPPPFFDLADLLEPDPSGAASRPELSPAPEP